MSDAKLRELERRWRETGSVDDEAAYLRERVRVGDLTQERLELAAYCGDQASVIAGGSRSAPAELTEWLAQWTATTGPPSAGLDALKLVLGLEQWGDAVVARAVLALIQRWDEPTWEKRLAEALTDWCECPCRTHALAVEERIPRDVPVGSSAATALGAFVAQSALLDPAIALKKVGSRRALVCFALSAAQQGAHFGEIAGVVRGAIVAWARAPQRR